MKQYTIEFFYTKRSGEELLIRMEFEREHFTNHEFKDYVLLTLFDLACQGSEYKALTARVKCEGKDVLTVKCDTVVGPYTSPDSLNEINAFVSVARPREKFRRHRVMNIAR